MIPIVKPKEPRELEMQNTEKNYRFFFNKTKKKVLLNFF